MTLQTIFFHPSLLVFVGVLSIPTVLLVKRNTLVKVDKGFVLIVVGVTILSLATFTDYLIQVVIGLEIESVYVTDIWQSRELILAMFFYLPGTLVSAVGLSTWLPAIQRLDREIKRRTQTEFELVGLTEELERLAVKAEEANHAKSEFLASMSHELRTPLNAIIGFSQIIAKDIMSEKGNPQFIEYGGFIETSGQHLLDIVNDLLDLAKVEAGEITLEESVVELTDVISDCLSIMRPIFEAKEIHLCVEAQTERTKLQADVRVVKQMLINLLSNAVKFSDPQNEIFVRLTEVNGAVCLSVADNGVGMNPDQIDYVLKPFNQIENVRTRSHQGTGLGLTIVKQMVELHGGNIDIETEEGLGTTVTLCFPPERSCN